LIANTSSIGELKLGKTSHVQLPRSPSPLLCQDFCLPFSVTKGEESFVSFEQLHNEPSSKPNGTLTVNVTTVASPRTTTPWPFLEPISPPFSTPSLTRLQNRAFTVPSPPPMFIFFGKTKRKRKRKTKTKRKRKRKRKRKKKKNLVLTKLLKHPNHTLHLY
jgi:hypothetical protein